MKAGLSDEINLDRGITARVVDGACVDLGDTHCRVILLNGGWLAILVCKDQRGEAMALKSPVGPIYGALEAVHVVEL